MCWLTVNSCGANTFPSLRTPRVSRYKTWVCDVVKRVLYFSTQHLLCSIIFHCKTWFCLRSVGDSLYKEYLNYAILPSCLTLHSVKWACWSHCHPWKNGGGNILNFRSCSFLLKFYSKNFFVLPWRNLYIIFSSRVSQDHILSGKCYMCYHLALIYHLNTHAVAMSFTQQCELRRMALDGVSWVPFQHSSTFITLWPWLSHSTFFLCVSTERWEMNKDDMCKIHVLWEKGGCCMNLIVRHE